MNDLAFACNLPKTGMMTTRDSAQVAASRCGVGCETLDREHFDPRPVFPRLAELGIKWARLQTGWIKCEKEPGVYDFAWLDWQVDTLLKLGIQPWFNLGYGNPLYTPEAGPDANQAVGKVPLNSYAAISGWLRYVEALVTHFRDRVQIYEVWNEPDHPKFWCDRERSGEQYARLFSPTQAAVHRAYPEARMAALALTGNALTPHGHRYIRDFFDQLADPAAVDIVTFHPYRSPPDRNYAVDLQALRNLVAGYNPQAEIWQGECGYPSQPGGTGGAAGGAANTENIQAKWLTRHVLCNLGLGVKHVSWFHAVDLIGYREAGRVNPKGLLRVPEISPKPSFHAYQRLCAVFDADMQATTRQWRAEVRTTTEECAMPTVKAFHFIHANGKRYMAYWRDGGIEDQCAVLQAKVWIEGKCDSARLLDPCGGPIYSVAGEPEDEGTAFVLPLVDYALVLESSMAEDN